MGAPASDWQASVDQLLAPFDRPGMPGLAVGVLRDGELVYARGAGSANLETGEPITAQSNFRLASVTKQLTAAAILRLVEDGRLSLEDRLGDVLPGFTGDAHRIGIRQLLQHRSGLLDYEDLLAPGHEPQLQERDVLAMLQRQPGLMHAPGARFHYSNSGYVLLGLIIEQRASLSFGDYLQQRLFAPLQMHGSRAYDGEPGSIGHRAYGYTVSDGTAKRTDQAATSALLGDGGVYSSLQDMARWIAGIERGTALAPASLQLMFTPVQDPETPGVGYGLGWFIDAINGRRRHWHTGSSIGFRHKLLHFPDLRLAVIVLGNMHRSRTPDLADQIAGLVDADLRIDPASAPPRPVTR